MEQSAMEDKVESLINTIEGTIRIGGISNDTRLIAQGLLLNALVLLNVDEKLKRIHTQLTDIV